MQADWRIPASSPFFMVSSDGRVKVTDTGELANILDNGHGYKQVQIMRNAKRYTRYVHRLVAECFLDNAEGYTEVNHIDGNKANNDVNNLEWCNHSQNLIHAFRTGLRQNTTPKQQEAARKNAERSREAFREGWKRWSQSDEARCCWLKNIAKADRWGTRNEPEEVKAERRREKKRSYYQEHKEERSRKAHERYIKAKQERKAQREGNYA